MGTDADPVGTGAVLADSPVIKHPAEYAAIYLARVEPEDVVHVYLHGDVGQGVVRERGYSDSSHRLPRHG